MELKNFKELARFLETQKKKRVVVAAAAESHIIQAVIKAEKENVITALLVGNQGEIEELAKKENYKFKEEQFIEADKGEEAQIAVKQIKIGNGDVLMKGKLQTSDFLRAVVNKEHGIGGDGLMSHVAILEIPAYHKLLGVSDGGMIPEPDIGMKSGITKNAITFFQSLGYINPKVALLTAAEVVNSKIVETVDADQIKRFAQEGLYGKCTVEGPISFDLAISKESSKIKGFQSQISGETDLLIVPNMVTGNSISKALIFLGGAKMAGCVVGADVPIVLTSRGATLSEKYFSILICAALSDKYNN